MSAGRRQNRFLVLLAVAALLAFALERTGYLPGTLDRAFAHTPCGIPVHYVLGEVDPRFGFDRFTVTAALVEAANLWQSTTGQLLFIESDHPLAMTVELRFDERQAAANTRRSLRGGLERDRRQLAEEEAALVHWNDRIADSRQAHDRAGEDLTLRVRTHEAEVVELERAGESLNADIAAYNRRAADLRQRSEEFLSRVARYNETAADGPVESGRYSYDRAQGRRIEVYRAESYDELVWVLAHELGHALAIDHVDDPGAIMNAMLHDGGELQPGRARPVALSAADLDALQAVCGERLR
jgi:hypothetical protein